MTRKRDINVSMQWDGVRIRAIVDLPLTQERFDRLKLTPVYLARMTLEQACHEMTRDGRAHPEIEEHIDEH